MHTESSRQNLNVVIVDDEERAGDALRLMLEKFVPQVQHISVGTDARTAAGLISFKKPDLVFLDIKMPYLSGFDVLQQIPHRGFKIVFTTAFNEFAIQAIRFSAFDYLLKPVDVEELVDTVNRFLTARQTETNRQVMLLQNMMQNINDTADNFRLAIPFKEDVHFIRPSEILYLQGMNNYTRFHIRDGRQLVTSKTLGDYEDMLQPYGFLRCHKSYIVNKNAVTHVDHDGFLVLNKDTRLEVSKRKKAEVMKLIGI